MFRAVGSMSRLHFTPARRQGVVTTIGRVFSTDQDEIKQSSRFPGENPTIKVTCGCPTCTYAVGGGGGAWIRMGGANEAGHASKQGSRNQAVFFK